MIRMTIVKDDNIVGIDGIFYSVDCSHLPENFHALQWYGNEGEVEWKGIPKPQNTIINSLDDYMVYVSMWNDAKDKIILEL